MQKAEQHPLLWLQVYLDGLLARGRRHHKARIERRDPLADAVPHLEAARGLHDDVLDGDRDPDVLVLAGVLGLEAKVAGLPTEQVEQRIVDLLLDEVLEQLAVEVTLVDEDLAQTPAGLLLLLDLLKAERLPQLLLRDHARLDEALAERLTVVVGGREEDAAFLETDPALGVRTGHVKGARLVSG